MEVCGRLLLEWNEGNFPACMHELGTYLFLSIGARESYGTYRYATLLTLFSAFGSYFPFLLYFLFPIYLRNAYSTVQYSRVD